MVWREQKDYVTGCYFCLTKLQAHRHKTRKNIQHPDLPSAIRHVQHSVDLPIPMLRVNLSILDEESQVRISNPLKAKEYHICLHKKNMMILL